MNELISIVMPVKNAASYLSDCLESILAQTYKNWELLAINDSSEDASLAILKDYAQRDRRIKVNENKGQGIIPALQCAYALSEGKYVTRMDADDKMGKEKLELMYAALKKKGRGHVAVGLVEYFSISSLGDGYSKYAMWLNKLTTAGRNFDEIYKECPIPSSCWMLSRNDFEKVGAFNSELYPEDYDLAFRLKQYNFQIIPITSILHYWRDHPERTSRNDNNYADNSFIQIKVKYFLEEDYNEKCQLVVWGAGNKGKKLAKTLTECNVDFRWVCNNNNKIGHSIYGKVLQPMELLNDNKTMQVIVTISGEHDTAGINQFVNNKQQHAFYRFS